MVLVYHGFSLFIDQCSHRVGVGAMLVKFVLCYGPNGHRDAQLLTTLESVGILVGDCGLSIQSCFIAVQSLRVVSSLESPQLRRFSGWCFSFSDPQKRVQKECFGSDAFWPVFFRLCHSVQP